MVFLMQCIDNTQDGKIREKLNPFHARFTVKTAIFMLAKLVNIWIEIIFGCSFIQFKKSFKIMQFARETSFNFHAILDHGCCLSSVPTQVLRNCDKSTHPHGLSVKTIQFGWSSVRSTNWTQVKFSQCRMAYKKKWGENIRQKLI